MVQGRANRSRFQFPFGPIAPPVGGNPGVVGIQPAAPLPNPPIHAMWGPGNQPPLGSIAEAIFTDHQRVLSNRPPITRYNNPPRGNFNAAEASTLMLYSPNNIPIMMNMNYAMLEINSTHKFSDINMINQPQFAQEVDNFSVRISAQQPVPRNITTDPVIAFAAAIYERLWVNEVGSYATFYLEFFFLGRAGAFWMRSFTGNGAQQHFFKVRLASRSTIRANSEIVYLAAAITVAITDFADGYYKNLGVMDFDLQNVRISQTVYQTHGRFTPIISGGGTIGDISDLISHSPDQFLRSDMSKLNRKLSKAGMMLTSPGTYLNCLFVSMELAITGRRWETMSGGEKRDMQLLAKNRKKRIGIIGKVCLTEFVKKMNSKSRSWLKNVSVEIFNIHGNILGELQHARCPAPDLVRIFVFGKHAMAVVPRKETIAEPTFALIERSEMPTKKTNLIGYWDMETTTSMKPYMIGFMINRMRDPIIFEGLDCVDQFLSHLERCDYGQNINLYAHNSGKFDTPILHQMRKGYWKIANILVLKNGRVIQYKLFNPSCKKTVNFLDSYPLMPSSLDELSIRYEVAHPKMNGAVDHNLMTDEDWEYQDLDLVRRYLKYDVLSLAECLDGWRDDSMRMYHVDPIERGILTGPSISKNIFISRYYDSNLFPLYHLPSEISKYVRRAYHGGRSDLGFRGVTSGVNYYDIVSQYPSAMMHDLPYGKPKWRVFTEMHWRFNGFVTIRARGGADTTLTLRVKDPKLGLITPRFDVWTEIVIYSDELRMVLKYNHITRYEIEIQGGYYFDHGPYLSQITQKFFEIKTAAKSVSDAAYIGAKARLNSIYGHFVFAEWGRQVVLADSDLDLASYLSSGNMIQANGDLAIVDGPLHSKMRYVPTGAAIASKAYCMLMENVMAILKAGYTCFYTDTDSLVTDAPSRVIESVQPIGTNLGDMELELGDIQEAVFVAPKIYALRSAKKDVVKIKGVPTGPYKSREDTEDGVIFRDRDPNGKFHILYEDIRSLVMGYTIRVSSFRVYGGKTALVNGEGLESRIPTVAITGKYRKGHVGPDGFVHPL
jgi:hypothetical protein